MDNFLEIMTTSVENRTIIAFLFTFLAGIATSFTPCSLSSISLIIGYVGNSNDYNKWTSLKISLSYAFGISLTFTALAVVTSYFGKIFSLTNSTWYLILGFLMVLMSLQIWELFNFIPSSYLTTKNKLRGNLGAFLAGVLSGLFSSPCSTPILIVLLGVTAQKGNILYGILLLLLYTIGHNIIVIVAGIFMGSINRITQSKNYGLYTQIIKGITGAFVQLIGFYLLYVGF